MPNTQQNIQNEIEQSKKEIDLLQDRLKKNEKSLNQFQNGLIHIRRIRVKKGQRTDLSQTREIQNIVKDILQNKIRQIQKNTNLLQNILAQVKKRKRLFEKGLKKIMQNLSRNEFHQITEMRGQSRDELERIAKIIISLLKSKESIAEHLNNNLDHDDDKISYIRRIFNRLKVILPKRYRKEIKKKLYEIEKNEDLSEAEKEENDEYLRKLVRDLNNKEKCPYDRDDFDYYGIRDRKFISLV